MLHHNHNTSSTTPPSSSQIAASSQHNTDNKNNNNGSTTSASGVLLVPKRKRRPAGTPDPDAEVVCLSPKTLMESERYVCEICKKGFQREQNLQMHRRKHKVPWKLVKNKKNPNSTNSPRRDDEEEEDSSNNNKNNKKVFVCPEASCLHHDPCHALGDLVGIKKHFRRKHSNHKQWVCDKCSKAYAVLSDFKAHLKTCGTRGHSCDCGRVFSRVESFIEHQDSCSVRPLQGGIICSSSRTASTTTSPSTKNKDANLSIVSDVTPLLLQGLPFPPRPPPPPHHHHKHNNILQELQLLRCSNSSDNRGGNHMEEEDDDEIENNHETETHLKLSIGSSNSSDYHNKNNKKSLSPSSSSVSEDQVRLAMKEKAYAKEARREARREVEMAEAELGRAKRLRKEAQEELQRAEALKEQAMMNMRSTLMHITCHPCKQLLHFQSSSQHTPSSSSSSIVINYMSSQTQGE